MKRIITLVVVVMVLLAVVCNVFAEENVITTQSESDEYIYYSDLFYGYSYYLSGNYYLKDFESDTYNLTKDILKEYITTEHFDTSVKLEALRIASDLTSAMKYVSDNIGLSSFALNEELDAANLKFVETVCSVNVSASKEIGSENKYVKNLNKYANIVKDIDKALLEDEAVYKNLSEPEVYKYFSDRAFALLEKYFTQIEPKLPSLKAELYTALSEATEIIGTTADAVDFVKALCLSLTMQETQLEIVQDIIDTQDTSTTLYKGMVRLKNQLEGGFMGYFLGTYLEDKIYNKVIGYLPELTAEKLLGSSNVWVKAATAVIDVAVYVGQDILGYDYSKYASAVILTEYASDLYSGLCNKALIFQKQFDTEEIKKYETYFNAYYAMKAEAFEECKALAVHNSECNLTYAEDKEDLFNKEEPYKEYIDGVRFFIMAIKPENRIITDYGTWNINENCFLRHGSNIVEPGVIYLMNNSFYGNIKILNNNTLTIAKGVNATINGNLYLGDASRIGYLKNEGDLTVTGEVGLYYISILGNYGTLKVNKHLWTSSTNTSCSFTMDDPNSVLIVGGNISFNSLDHCDITDGKMILNGTEQQLVQNVKFVNTTIENDTGILLLSLVYVFGDFETNGCLIDNNDYSFNLKDGGWLSNNDYGKVTINGNQTFIKDITYTGETEILYNNTLTIAKGVNATINGNLYLGDASRIGYLKNEGDLTVTGEVGLYYISILGNYGTLKVNKHLWTSSTNTSCSFTMDDPNSVLIVGGNISFNSLDHCDITDGKMILNGTEQQSVKNLKAPDVIIENSSIDGVVFNSTVSVSKLFDHKGNSFTLYNNGVDSIFPDYDGDGLLDHIDPTPTIPFVEIKGNMAIIESGNNIQDVIAMFATTHESVEIYLGDKDISLEKINIATGMTIYANEEQYVAVVPGDVNGDGEMNIVDAQLLINHIRGSETMDNCYKEAAIVIGESTNINIITVTQLLNMILV